ncbi:MAG: hypothetical protein AAF585_03315 [Verrucomicrobiota bacterium]
MKTTPNSKTKSLILAAAGLLVASATPAMAIDRGDLIPRADRLEHCADLLLESFIANIEDRRARPSAVEGQVIAAMKDVFRVSVQLKKDVRCTTPLSTMQKRLMEVNSDIRRIKRLTSCVYLDGDTRVVLNETVKAYDRFESDLDRLVAASCPLQHSPRARSISSDRDDFRYSRSSDSGRRSFSFSFRR